jgi:hypothetical protein
MQPFNQLPGAPDGWLVKFDPKTGKIMGHLDCPEGVPCVP